MPELQKRASCIRGCQDLPDLWVAPPKTWSRLVCLLDSVGSVKATARWSQELCLIAQKMQRAFRPLHSSHTNRAAKTWMCCPLQASEIQEVEEVLVKLVRQHGNACTGVMVDTACFRLLANIAISPSAGSTLASSRLIGTSIADPHNL